MQKVAQWYVSNKMAVNTSKTKYIIFRTRGKKIDIDIPPVVFNSHQLNTPQDPAKIFPLERISNDSDTKYYKLLGALLDEFLSFEHHINGICKKLSKSIYYIRRVKNLLLQKTYQLCIIL